MELKLIDQAGQAGANVAATDEVFGREYNEALIHQVVTAYMANGRRGTRAQKDRGEVKHSTKKPFKQKGTGRARAGKIFPNRPDENFSHKLNKKMYRAGVCSILSQLAREGRLTVVDQLNIDAPKTKLLAQKIKSMGFEQVLIVTDAVDENLELSSRNLPNVNVVTASHADPISLIRHANVLLTKKAVAKFEELLK